MDTLEEYLSDVTEATTQAPTDKPIDSRAALAEVALLQALGREGKRLFAGTSLIAAVVKVPSQQWVAPIKTAISQVSKVPVFIPTSPKKHADAADGAEMSSLISGGRRVIGIFASPAGLPDPLMGAATHEFTVPRPSAPLVASAMKLCLTGRLPRHFLTLDLLGLDFDTICACMPKGITKREAVDRIIKATHRIGGFSTAPAIALPTLEAAIEYGEAREWGLDLKQDIDDVRAKKIGWNAVDRGIVLYGEPGTGKTSFARILGQSCGLTTFVKSTADLFATSSGDLGSVIKAQRQMFEEAEASAPSLLMLDEIDAYPDPFTISERGKDWWMPVILDLQLLLDSAVSARDGVIVCGATNRIGDISRALLRKGRLERAVYIGPPNLAGLVNVLRTHLGSELPEASLLTLARAGEGATAAEAMDWARSARRKCRREDRPMTIDDMMDQIRPPDHRSDTEKLRVAIHESGHAIIGMMLGYELAKVSIRQGAGRGGRVTFASQKRTILMETEIEDQVVCSLAGRAAEIVLLGAPSSGSGGRPESDLAQATQKIAELHASLGLKGELTWHGFGKSAADLIKHSPSLKEAIESDLQRLHAVAIDMARTHVRLIDVLARALVEKQSMTGTEVAQLLLGGSLNSPGDPRADTVI
jgi:cell division protease FtsH